MENIIVKSMHNCLCRDCWNLSPTQSTGFDRHTHRQKHTLTHRPFVVDRIPTFPLWALILVSWPCMSCVNHSLSASKSSLILGLNWRSTHLHCRRLWGCTISQEQSEIDWNYWNDGMVCLWLAYVESGFRAQGVYAGGGWMVLRCILHVQGSCMVSLKAGFNFMQGISVQKREFCCANCDQHRFLCAFALLPDLHNYF